MSPIVLRSLLVNQMLPSPPRAMAAGGPTVGAEKELKSPQLNVHHDEDVEIYINGVLAAAEGGFTTTYVPLEIRPPALALLKAGKKVLLAAHCHQTAGGQNIDIGLVRVRER